MDLERLANLLDRMERIAVENEERWLETEAMLSAQRFLIEQQYANAFLGDVPGFDRFMDGLIDKTRTAATVSQPTGEESKIELQARVATHLTRFAASVRLRLTQGIRPSE
jgi:hypothetical protein